MFSATSFPLRVDEPVLFRTIDEGIHAKEMSQKLRRSDRGESDSPPTGISIRFWESLNTNQRDGSPDMLDIREWAVDALNSDF